MLAFKLDFIHRLTEGFDRLEEKGAQGTVSMEGQ